MSPVITCAAPGCDNPVARHPGRIGRPPIYCSPACRPSPHPARIVVELDRIEGDDGVDAGRGWAVRLRRGRRAVTIGTGLGRLSAAALAAELCDLFGTGAP